MAPYGFCVPHTYIKRGARDALSRGVSPVWLTMRKYRRAAWRTPPPTWENTASIIMIMMSLPLLRVSGCCPAAAHSFLRATHLHKATRRTAEPYRFCVPHTYIKRGARDALSRGVSPVWLTMRKYRRAAWRTPTTNVARGLRVGEHPGREHHHDHDVPAAAQRLLPRRCPLLCACHTPT